MKIRIVAHPNSKKPRIEKDSSGVLHIYVSESPLEGKANKAITNALAKYLHTKKSHVSLISGSKSKNKTFKVLS